MFERKAVTEIYGPAQEGERWRIRTNKEIKNILQGADMVKMTKSLRQRWYGYVERMQNQRMSKSITTDTMEGTRQR
jgi:hypothetical protein